MDFAKELTRWYEANGRDLPWRNTREPYKIWISEVILQQTRVMHGMSYYLKFIETFPDLSSLASAPEDTVLRVWQGLGYYSRARNLHHAAKTIVEQYNGKFPQSYKEIMQLKGIGTYTAGAIASIAFGEPVTAVDGNVKRVISRIFAIEEPVDSSTGDRMINSALEEIFDHQNPGTFNQAIMDFGAVICKPKNPNCEICPLASACLALKKNIVNRLPVKSKEIVRRKRYLNYLFIIFEENQETFTWIHKRNGKDIWHGLYQFPLIEADLPVSPNELLNMQQWIGIVKNSDHIISSISPVFMHQLTHQQLFARVYQLKISNKLEVVGSDFKMVKMNDLTKFAMPRLLVKYLASATHFTSDTGNNSYELNTNPNFAK